MGWRAIVTHKTVFWGFCVSKIHKVRPVSKYCLFHSSYLAMFRISLTFSIPEFSSVVIYNNCLYHPRLMNFYFPISQILLYLLKIHYPPCIAQLLVEQTSFSWYFYMENLIQQACLPIKTFQSIRTILGSILFS